MPLSSNWKALQKQIATSEPTTNKRKRTVTTSDLPRNPRKKAKLVAKMGSLASTITTTGPKSSEPVTEPADSPAPTENLINQGLHPTHKPGKYLSLDCEMVGTGPPPADTHVLARVSIVNYHGQQIYDSYVQPSMPVSDYRTHVSGIRAENLVAGIARPFREVRETALGLFAGRILVGHALKGDLDVLVATGLVPRQNIRDTSRYSAYRARSKGKTPGLKRLALEVLGEEIQEGEHDSVIDARTAMALFRKEKEGIERECRKRWGDPRGMKPVVASQSGDADDLAACDFDDEDDEDDDEDESGTESTARVVTTGAKTKRKKKKSKRR